MAPFAGELYRLGSRLEKKLGCPQDIEWAVADGKLFLLQSRPITTLIGNNPATGEWNDSLTGDFLWSNVNFGEAIAHVMTPFTWAAVQKSALGERATFEGNRPFGNIGGRLYLNISVFASIFHVLGKNARQTRFLIEGTLHLNLPEGMEVPLIPSGKRSLVSTLLQLIAGEWRQWRDVRRLPALLLSNPLWCKSMQREIREVRTKAELVSLWRAAIGPRISRIWSGVLSSASHHDSFITPLRRELAELVGPFDADALISGMSSESEVLASLGPVIGLSKVVRGEITREEYLEEYGHRGPDELELYSPRPAEIPGWFDRQVAVFNRALVDVEVLLAKRRAESEAAWQRLSQRYPRRGKPLRRRIDQIAPRARLREQTRSEFARVFWVWRAWALRAGEMTGLGADVFFLTIDEVLEALFGNREAMRHIPERRTTYERYRALPPYPPIINGRFDPLRWAADPNRRNDYFDSHAPFFAQGPRKPSSNTIIGAAGAGGRGEGVVRRLESLEEGEQFEKGEVLVTTQTNIGWTPLFPRAAAIVTDVGAPLSHAAIVARELGVPAVVGCGNAMMRLKTGDRVLVDGSRGVVEILSSASDIFRLENGRLRND